MLINAKIGKNLAIYEYVNHSVRSVEWKREGADKKVECDTLYVKMLVEMYFL